MAARDMTTKCDVIRAGAAAAMQSCGGANPPPACYVTDIATKSDAYFQTKYNPAGLLTGMDREIRTRELAILEADISGDAAAIQAEFGDAAPTDITWNDFTQCLWNPDGTPGGPHGNVYFDRADLASLGYQPRPALGGAALEGKLPAQLTGPVPVWLDRALNPDLAVVVILAILVLVCAALVRAARRGRSGSQERRAAKSARSAPGARGQPGASRVDS